MALNVATCAELESWTAWLDELGIEHSGIRAGEEPFPFATVVFRDPDNSSSSSSWLVDQPFCGPL